MTSEEIDNILDLMGMYYSYTRWGNSGVIYIKDPTTADQILKAVKHVKTVKHGPNTQETKLAAYMQLINQGETK